MNQTKTMTPSEIRNIRLRLGLTQTAFARALGVHPVTASRWECNRGQASTSLVYAILDLAKSAKPSIKEARLAPKEAKRGTPPLVKKS